MVVDRRGLVPHRIQPRGHRRCSHAVERQSAALGAELAQVGEHHQISFRAVLARIRFGAKGKGHVVVHLFSRKRWRYTETVRSTFGNAFARLAARQARKYPPGRCCVSRLVWPIALFRNHSLAHRPHRLWDGMPGVAARTTTGDESRQRNPAARSSRPKSYPAAVATTVAYGIGPSLRPEP